MSITSARLGLPYLMPAQAQKHVTHNEALRLLDALAQLVIEDVEIQVPPVNPTDGSVYALGSAPSGEWIGQAGQLAYRTDDSWLFVQPEDGWRAWDRAAVALRTYQGGQWHVASPNLQNTLGLGIGTTFDGANKLSVAAGATLLSHDGTDHQLKLNKATTGDTASLLYQNGFVGHAEMGLTGDNDFHIKISPDGSSWVEALVLDAASGTASGTAVQSTTTDASNEKLLRVGAFGLGSTEHMPLAGDANLATTSGAYTTLESTLNVPSPTTASLIVSRSYSVIQQSYYEADNRVWARRSTNTGVTWTDWDLISGPMVGPVSVTAGKPSGSTVEHGENANGRYTRWADGTQICWVQDVDMGSIMATGTGTYSYPYRTDVAIDVTWPAVFSMPPIAEGVVHLEGTGLSPWAQMLILNVAQPATTNGWFSLRASRSARNTEAGNAKASFIAVGRWN